VKDNKILWGKTLEDTKRLHKVSFSPDGRMIYTGGSDLTIYGLETATGNLLNKLNIPVSTSDPSYSQQKTISAIEVCPGSRTVFGAGAMTKIFIFDSVTGKVVGNTNHGGWSVVDFAVSPDSTRFATADMRAASKIKVWRMSGAN
jgi:WD40 repeat protein